MTAIERAMKNILDALDALRDGDNNLPIHEGQELFDLEEAIAEGKRVMNHG